MKKIIISALILIGVSFTNFVPMQAGAPTCATSSSGSAYCSFNGTISRLYINASNDILVYFDQPMASTGVSEAVGFTIGNHGRHAGILRITDANEKFSKSFYATALAALTANKTVTIQMRGVQSGYLKMDRIWIAN